MKLEDKILLISICRSKYLMLAELLLLLIHIPIAVLESCITEETAKIMFLVGFLE